MRRKEEKVGYANLKAEMARRNINIKDIMAVTGKSRSGVSKNLNGQGAFSVEEGINIRDKFRFATEEAVSGPVT